MFHFEKPNESVVNYTSGVVPMTVRARKCWVNHIPEELYDGLRKKYGNSVRFMLYGGFDEEVLSTFVSLCKKSEEECDTDELMEQAGKMTAASIIEEFSELLK